MPEYIEKARLLERLTDYYNQAAMDDTKPLSMRTAANCLSIIGGAPAADVVEVRHGEWIEDGYHNIPCLCSCCGAEAPYTSTFEETFGYDWEENLCPTGYEETREYIRTPFCSNCGAKMDGGKQK